MLADAAHISELSQVKLEISMEHLPLSSSLLSRGSGSAGKLALSAGDDYELLFTISESNWDQLMRQNNQHIYSKIGRVNKGSGVVVKNNGIRVNLSHQLSSMGFKHFE